MIAVIDYLKYCVKQKGKCPKLSIKNSEEKSLKIKICRSPSALPLG